MSNLWKMVEAGGSLTNFLKEAASQPDKASCASFCRVNMPQLAEKLASLSAQSERLDKLVEVMRNASGLRDDDIIKLLNILVEACEAGLNAMRRG